MDVPELLARVFGMLPFRQTGVVPRTSRGWRDVARSTHWMSDRVVFFADDPNVPRLLSLPSRVDSVACGHRVSFFVCRDATYRVGRGWTDRVPDTMTPVRVETKARIRRLAVKAAGYYHHEPEARGYHVLAIDDAGRLHGCGANPMGQLFRSDPRLDALEPVEGIEHAVDVSCGVDFSVVLTRDRCVVGGTYSRWMDDLPPGPRDVPRPPGAQSVHCGGYSAAVLTSDGVVYTFGSSCGCDLSDGDLLGRGSRGVHSVPRPIAGRYATVRGSTYTFVALGLDGVAYTWGDSDGGATGRAAGNDPGVLAVNVGAAGVSYPSGALVGRSGEFCVWGGGDWSGGVGGWCDSADRRRPTVIGTPAVPPWYAIETVQVGQDHAVLVYRKRRARV
jgi:hypothetical protein